MSNKPKFNTQNNESNSETNTSETNTSETNTSETNTSETNTSETNTSETNTSSNLNDASRGGLLIGLLGSVFSLLQSVNTNYANSMMTKIGSSVEVFTDEVSQHPLLQNDKNRGWFLIGGAFIGTFFLISMLWQFIFNFMLSYASIKVFLWFLEHYTDSSNNTDSNTESNEIIGDHYVSEESPVDVIEYVVVLLFVAALTPIAYFPYMSLLTNGSCVMLSVTTLASKDYRRKVCRFVKDLLVSPDYVSGKKMEGRVHSALQTFCFTVETLNISTFNMTHNSRSIVSDLNKSESFAAGFKRLTQKPLSLLKMSSDMTVTEDLDDDLDESFD
jgi:hypothetical protein